MPADAPETKRQATLGYGAQLVFYNRQAEDREAIARQLATSQGLTLIHPYDDLRIMAGQGTAAMEFLQQIPDLDLLLAPVGGGGLLSGCSVVARALNPAIGIFGVEVDVGNDTYLSLQNGERVTIPLPQTIADGIRTTTPGILTFEVMRQTLDGILLVNDAEIWQAMQFLLWRMKMLVEPSGAVAVAAVLSGKITVAGKRVGIVISGGNVDAELLKALM
jgi:threonine dehydratase